MWTVFIVFNNFANGERLKIPQSHSLLATGYWPLTTVH